MIASKTDTRAEHPAPKGWLRANARSVRGLLLAGIGLAAAGVLLIVQAGLLAWVVYQILFRAEFWAAFQANGPFRCRFRCRPNNCIISRE